jgi:hypothetical protein
MQLSTQNHSMPGFTLIETMVASTIGLLFSGLLLSLFLQSAHEQKRSVRTMALQFHADLVQEKLTRLFREGSQSRTAQFLDEDSSARGLFKRIRFIHRKGTTEQPLELDYRNDDFVLEQRTPTPNGPEIEILSKPETAVVLRECLFQEIFLTNGHSRRSAIQVFLKFDDAPETSNSTAMTSTNTITRSFTVKFRNP